MIRNEIIRLVKFPRSVFSPKRNTSNDINIKRLEEESVKALQVEVSDEEAQLKEEAIQKSRNKSRLYASHRKILHNENPYSEPAFWHHGTLKYMRRTYGRYGEASGIDPALCWPTKQELNEKQEYERIAYPYNILQVAEEAKMRNKAKQERIQARQKEVAEKMLKLEGWKQDLFNRIKNKEKEAKEAQERKERLIEEVRAHFGYKVDPKEDKFKEMLLKKEKEQKKALKEERRKVKEARMVEKIMKKEKNVRNEPVEKTEELKEPKQLEKNDQTELIDETENIKK